MLKAIVILLAMAMLTVPGLVAGPQPFCWQTGTPPPAGRDHHLTFLTPAADGGHRLNVAGGTDYRAVYGHHWSARVTADGSIGPWVEVPDLPEPLAGSGVAVRPDGVLLIAGQQPGLVNIASVYHAPLDADGLPGRWAAAAPLPGPRFHHTATSWNEWVYVIGGMEARASTASVFRGRWVSGVSVQAWELAANLPVSRSHHATVEHGGALYVVGGQRAEPGAPLEPLRSVVRAPLDADGNVGRWDLAAQLDSTFATHAAFTHDGHLYVAGGVENNRRVTDRVIRAPFRPDGRLGPWESVTSLPTARSHVHQMPVVRDVVYAAGGSASRQVSDVVLVGRAGECRAAQGREASPAAEAVEALLEVVQSGDEARLSELIATRFALELRDMVPMEEHLRILGFLRRDLEGRERSGVRVRSATEASVILSGATDRLELRLSVEPEPPHRIAGLSIGQAGPDVAAASFDELALELERLARADGFSGVVLVGVRGAVRFEAAYGLADRGSGRPNRTATRFDIGSLNKLFTSAAVLRLVQDGRLGLDERVGRYLEGFDGRVADEVTVRHLLRHRSGFGDYLTHPEFEADPKRFRQPADYLPLARAQALAFEPGTRERYSNMGFVLLGAIIERVTGRGYAEAIDDLVFGPAGMETAGPAGGAAAARRYHHMPDGFMPVDDEYPELGTPAGGGFAAAIDLHRFVDALLGYRLLNEESTALLLNDFEAPTDGAAPLRNFGFAGGAPGVNAVILARSAERRWAVVLANIDSSPAEALARAALELANH